MKTRFVGVAIFTCGCQSQRLHVEAEGVNGASGSGRLSKREKPKAQKTAVKRK